VGVSVQVTTLSWPPSIGQFLVRFDGENPAIHATPIAAEPEWVIYSGLEIIFHQPLLDQMRLRQRAPDFFRREGNLPFDNDRTRLAGIAH
jgi:hypothetical protein